MKNGSRVYVSILSRSKVAGEAGTVIGSSVRDGYKVRTDFGVIGYVRVEHVRELTEDAPVKETPAQRSHVQAEDGFVVDRDVEHMYLTQIRPLVIDPTDLLCKTVRFEKPVLWTFTTDRGVIHRVLPHNGVWGRVSDQWIEDGVELLNVVFMGTYTVIPRSFVTHS